MNASVECKTMQGELNTEKKTGKSRVDQELRSNTRPSDGNGHEQDPEERERVIVVSRRC